MFVRFIRFCRRLSESKGFRLGTRICSCVLAAYILYSFVIYLIAVRDIGMSFWEALSFFFSLPLFAYGPVRASASVAIGIAVGLIWYFSRKQKTEKTEEEKPAGDSDSAQEEEIIETTHYRFH